MGNGFGQPYEQVEYESGASRFFKSIFMAVCVAPLLILGMCVMLGWNERNDVCTQKAISAGRDAVKTVTGCDNSMVGNGDLIMVTCAINSNLLPNLHLNNAGDFSAFQVQAVGVEVDTLMYQCIENKQQSTKKKSGGGTVTVTTYTYSQGWKSTYVNSQSFGTHSSQASDAFRSGCNSQQNPPFYSGAPTSSIEYAPEVHVGAFTIKKLAEKVPINTAVPFSAPVGWTTAGTGTFYWHQNQVSSSLQIGDMKVSLKRNDPSADTVTVLGKNVAGLIGEWVAPSSWLCSGDTVSNLKMGTVAKDDLFDEMANEATTLTWILRLVGFVVMWIAFCLCFGPLEVAGDCIPCVGPYIGDSIAAISCCVACLPATACTLGVAGVVWVVMRPLIGIPCMLAFVLIIGGFGFYIAKQKAAKRGGRTVQTQSLMSVQARTVQSQPSAPGVMIVQAQVGPGEMQIITTPDGIQRQVQVPENVAPGGYFNVTY